MPLSTTLHGHLPRGGAVALLTAVCLAVVISGRRSGAANGPPGGEMPRLPNSPWRAGDWKRPQPPMVTPGESQGTPPADAVVLFNGKDLSQWERDDPKSNAAGGPLQGIENGCINIRKTGQIRTKRLFGDCQLHVEWATPAKPDGDRYNWGNSGVFFIKDYELQIIESHDSHIYADGIAGAIYNQTPPLVNASRRPGQWQSFDVVFRAPRFDGEKLTSPGYFTVFWNGVLVQDHTALMGSTLVQGGVPRYTTHQTAGPIMLQYHNSAVRFRNIWFRPLTPAEAGSAKASGLSGIYVNEVSPEDRIEFVAGGKCFRSASEVSEGSYSGDGASLVCKFGQRGQFRFRREGRTLIDKDGNRWVPREDVDKIPWKEASPVTVVVLDEKTRRPLARFTYVYTVTSPAEEYCPLLVRPTEVRSTEGAFTIPAPELCEIKVGIKSDEIVGGGVWWTERWAKKGRNRRIEVLAKRGVAIEGTVVDAETGKPVQGAVVSPEGFTLPAGPPVPDEDRAVKTDAQGKFTIRGVEADLVVYVSHPEYFLFKNIGPPKTGKKIGEGLYRARIALRPGERFFGSVKDPSGNLLAGVSVSDGGGKLVQTVKDGSFALVSPLRENSSDYKLSFAKDGYLDARARPDAADPKGLSVVLRPLPVLSGRVLGPDGRPATAFTVSTIATGFGSEHAPPKCSSATVHHPAGRFSLPVNMTSRDDEPYSGPWKVWVGVTAPGFALWETTIDAWEGRKSIAVNMQRGVTVRGLVKVPTDRAKDVSAGLVLLRGHDDPIEEALSQRQDVGKMEVKPDAGGTFRFDNVGPGRYWLVVSGPAISPAGKEVTVSNSDVDAGTFSPRGRGSVCGVVYRPPAAGRAADRPPWVWAFAEGSIYFQDSSGIDCGGEFPHLLPIPFNADKKGRFRVDGVPVGMVRVDVPYFVHDFGGVCSRTAVVTEGKTTEIPPLETSGEMTALPSVASPPRPR